MEKRYYCSSCKRELDFWWKTCPCKKQTKVDSLSTEEILDKLFSKSGSGMIIGSADYGFITTIFRQA